MKNQVKLITLPFSLTNMRGKLFTGLMMLVAVMLMVSCSKQTPDMQADPVADGTEESNEAPVAEATASGNTYYLSPSGNDNNAGTISAPFKTLNKAWSVIAAGDIVYLRGGTYAFDKSQRLEGKNGAPGNLIKIWAYPGEKPTLTKTSGYKESEQDLMYMEGNYFHFKGLEIANFSQVPGGYHWPAFRVGYTNGSIFELIDYHHNAAGFSLRGDSDNNLFLNCDFHHNADPYSSPAYENGDGIDLHYITPGNTNTLRGCRAWWNGDDGFDMWDNNGYVLMEDCWSFYNGYVPGTFNTAGNGSGYKLGSTGAYPNTLLRTIKNNIAFKNRSYGFVENAANCKSDILNNVAVSNGDIGFWFGSWGSNVATLRNNIGWNNPQNSRLLGSDIHDHNTWNGGVTVNSADFKSMEESQLMAARQSDGSLPVITFLQLASGSDLINAGINVGLPFSGIAPDIASTEFGGVSTPPANQAPVANAGADKAVTLPTNTVTITGSGTDPDGTIVSYAWTRVSGPNTATLAGANTKTLTASNLIAGTYVFKLTVTDNGGLSASDNVNVVVSSSTPPANQAPTANAGPDKTITLPVNSIVLAGSGTDPDGTIVSYTWTYRNGPGAPTMAGTNTATMTASNLKAGTYTFRLTVKDNGGLTDYDQVKVVVNPAATPPVQNLINVSQAVHDNGYAYYVAQNFGTPADNNKYPTRSKLRIYENGVELTPPHSKHRDIQNIGQGRYSHWADGGFVALYFSASDNTNPKTNGRVYTYSIAP